MRSSFLLVLALAWRAQASLFDSDSDSTDSSATASAASSTSTSSTDAEVDFLEVLETAQISSMSCLITLVNMTGNAIGTCLGLTTLAPLIVGSVDGDFSANLDSYLTTVCAETCADADIGDAQEQLAAQCAGSSDTSLVSVLNAILDNYSSAYKTLACDVTFNATTALCLPATLNTSSTADTSTFFENLVGGTDIEQYYNSVFLSASCTGCMYEMYKAAVYTLPSIRDNNITTAMGDYLKSTCADITDPNWADVTDEQIPDSLEISQSSATAVTSGARRVEHPAAGLLAAAGALGMLLGAGAVDVGAQSRASRRRRTRVN
ncbi:hypothetical protein Q5752_006330 [Cryptotrichosporon argae]